MDKSTTMKLATVFKNEDEKAKKPQKFVLVEEPDSPSDGVKPSAVSQSSADLKTDQKNDPVSIRAFMAGAGLKIGVDSYKTNVAIRSQVNTSSGAFYGGVITLQPNSTGVTEATQFAALFDQARCNGVSVCARVTGNSTTAAAAWAMAFDPSNAGAYTSTVGIMVAKQHLGPVGFNDYGSATTTVATTATTVTGYQKKHFKTMKTLPSTGASAGEVVGNGWFATSDVNATVGYLKWAIDAVAGSFFGTDVFITYHMEYRSRT